MDKRNRIKAKTLKVKAKTSRLFVESNYQSNYLKDI